MDTPLTNKYRPESWDDLLGNEALKKSLLHILSRTTHRSFLFTGPAGCGKTTLARLLAKEVGGTEWSIHEFNGGNDRGIKSIREDIIPKMGLGSLDNGAKVFIIDEAHRLTTDAAEALLKPTEESGDCYFVLCTTEPQKLTRTFKQRLMTFEVMLLSKTQIAGLITRIASEEGFNVSPESIDRIAMLSEGSPRLAITYLEQAAPLNDGEIKELFSAVNEHDYDVRMLCRLFFRKDGSLAEAMSILRKLPTDPYQIRDAMMGYMFQVITQEGTGPDGSYVNGQWIPKGLEKANIAESIIINLVSPLGTSKAGIAVILRNALK